MTQAITHASFLTGSTKDAQASCSFIILRDAVACNCLISIMPLRKLQNSSITALDEDAWASGSEVDILALHQISNIPREVQKSVHAAKNEPLEMGRMKAAQTAKRL